MSKISLFFISLGISNLLAANQNSLMNLVGCPNHEVADYIAIYNSQINLAQSTEEADSLLNLIKKVARKTGEFC